MPELIGLFSLPMLTPYDYSIDQPLSHEDAAGVVDLFRTTYNENYHFQYRTTARALLDHLMVSAAAGAILKDGDKVIGHIGYRFCSDTELVVMGRLATHPEYRGQGLGSKLGRCAFEMVDKSQIILWNALGGDAKSAKIAQSLGFQRAGESFARFPDYFNIGSRIDSERYYYLGNNATQGSEVELHDDALYYRLSPSGLAAQSGRFERLELSSNSICVDEILSLLPDEFFENDSFSELLLPSSLNLPGFIECGIDFIKRQKFYTYQLSKFCHQFSKVSGW